MTCAPDCNRWSVSGGGLKKKPTARFASGGGLETFSSLLAVSPRAGSGNSRLSRSRGNRHGRLGRNSLGGGRHHSERKNSTRANGSEGKVWKEGKESSSSNSPDPSTGFSLGRGNSFAGETPVPWKECEGGGFRVVLRVVPRMSRAWEIQAFKRLLDASSKGRVENEKRA